MCKPMRLVRRAMYASGFFCSSGNRLATLLFRFVFSFSRGALLGSGRTGERQMLWIALRGVFRSPAARRSEALGMVTLLPIKRPEFESTTARRMKSKNARIFTFSETLKPQKGGTNRRRQKPHHNQWYRRVRERSGWHDRDPEVLSR
jgi:hypothetical protein